MGRKKGVIPGELLWWQAGEPKGYSKDIFRYTVLITEPLFRIPSA